MNDSPLTLLDVVQSAGTMGLLVVIVTAFLRDWVVTRSRFDAERREKEAWRAIALGGVKVSEKAIEALKGQR